jgi:UPF0716 protein FxsA
MPFLLLLIWIFVESWLMSRAVERFGGTSVAVWLLLAVVAGVSVIRRQGLRTIRDLQRTTMSGELPGPILLEGLVVIIAGALLIMPGFLSDILALSLLFIGLRKRLAERIGHGLAQARPDLKQPVTLEGDYKRKP